jgi:sugar phosphate isomerase/epimerase
MEYTRREFGKLALAGVPAAGVLRGGGVLHAAMQAGARPMTKWAGVQVGMNVPYNLGTGNNLSAQDLLAQLLEIGVSGLELRAQPVEHFLGSPTVIAAATAAAAGGGRRGGGGRAGRAAGDAADGGARGAAGGRQNGPAGARQGGGGRGRGEQTPEQVAAQRQAAEEVRKWRLSAPTSRIRDFRKMYEDAGIVIEILKVDGLYTISDEELDYFFQMARDLGARAVSAELPSDLADAKRVGQFADKYRIMAAYHAHQQNPLEWEEAFSLARYNGANVDIGHFTAAQNRSPLPFITSHHDRIPHIHVKDRKLGTNGGQNMPFGQGDTQIREILRAIRDNKWNIQATIEFEYPVPEGSTRVAELKKTLAYCRDALLA